jgi:hypothetical protein
MKYWNWKEADYYKLPIERWADILGCVECKK